MKKLQGIIPPVITPLLAGGKLDVPGLEKLLEHIIAGGVHGLFILGSTGEGPALGTELQHQMITETVRIVNHRLPILVGISSAALNDTIALADYAYEAGADAAVSAPPCYFMPGGAEIIDYFTAVAKAIKLPLFIYNMPSMTKINLDPAMVLRLAQIPNIIGYKDSAGNMCNLHEVIIGLKDRDDFSVLVGPEEMLGETVLFGGDGGVSGGANLNPRLFVTMYNAAKTGDVQTMRECQAKIYKQRKLYSLGHYQSSIIKGIKCALSLKGICQDFMVPPFEAFAEKERNEVKAILAEL